MKRIICILATLAFSAGAYAQTADDAIMLSQEYYEGTARTMAMGNAFTAIGGDLGAIAANPASSGVYTYSQFAFTPSVTITPYSSTYIGSNLNGSNSKMTFSNAGFITSFDTGGKTGLLNFNFGVVYNKKRTFNSYLCATGQTDESSMLASIGSSLYGIHSPDLEFKDGYNPYYNSSAPWRGILAWNTYGLSTFKNIDEKRFPDVDDEYVAATENFDPETKEAFVADYLAQNFSRSTYGGIQEFAFNFGCNISDILYLGLNLNLEAVNYSESQTYSESAFNPSAFQDGFVNMSQTYWRQTTGSGFSTKIGAILTPVSGLRIGATFTTPTWYSLKDSWYYGMEVSFNNGKRYVESSPTGIYNYKLTAPLRFSVGMAYTFGRFGMISAEYERVSYNAAQLKDVNGNITTFAAENAYIQSAYGSSNIFRIGGEVWAGRIALRGGYDRFSKAAIDASAVSFWSCGLGFKLTQRSAIDVAFQRWNMGERNFTLYDGYFGLDAPVGTARNKVNKVALTFSFKF